MNFLLQIFPVTGIVILAASVGTAFMSWKLFHTPDVVYNPALHYNWQAYDAKHEHSVDDLASKRGK